MMVNTQMAGMDMAFPDVCIVPGTPPVPTPLPNIAMRPMAIPTCPNVLILGAPVHNLATIIPMSNGDNAGVLLGVASGTVMGPCRKLTGAFQTMANNMPLTRVTSSTLQNSTNAPGISGVPSQTNVIALK